jgi:hypothetical protein
MIGVVTASRRCLLLLLGFAALAGCRGLDAFSTVGGERYRGTIVPADDLRRGADTDGDTVDDVLGEGTTLEMTLRVEELRTTQVGRVTTSDGLLDDTTLEPITRMGNDTLSAFTFPQGRLWNGMYFARAAAGAPGGLAGRELLVILSLMVDDVVEVRIIGGADDLYGVFRLRKQVGP